MDKTVSLIACQSYAQDQIDRAVKTLLSHYGGAIALAGGKRVLIKPNLLMARDPKEVTTTHPGIVKALAREFISAGCHVTIADSCGGTYTHSVLRRLYRTTGMEQVAEETGAVLNYDLSSKEMEYCNGKRIGRIPIISPVHDAEFVISVAKMKTHGLTYYTGAVKNLFGVVPGLTKPMYHAKFPDKTAFCEMIVDLCELVSPGFSVIDGIVGMQGKGPSGGSSVDAGVLLGGRNPHAVDLAALRVMGLDPQNAPTVHDAMLRGFIPERAGELIYLGDDPAEHELHFLPASGKTPGFLIRCVPKKFRSLIGCLITPYPSIVESHCVGCGDCARTCPMHTIEIIDHKAHIQYDQCVKCYCCHELCPVRAISFKRIVKKS